MKQSIIGVAVTTLLATACSSDDSSGGDPASPASERLAVVTTVSPITNIVQNVGGDCVTIIGIVPEGTNSHTFEPQPSDAAAFTGADIVFINGLDLEEPSKELAEANLAEGSSIIELGSMTITPDEYIYDFSFPEAGGDPNPHLWTNPLFAKRYAEIVKDELSTIDRGCAGEYESNYDAFAARIDELDRMVRDVTATVPEENRKLLTYHDSFPYFAREYGWEVIGAIQPSDFADPTPQDVASLIDQVESENIPAIFGSEVFPSPVLEQIASESGAQYIDDLRDDDLPGENGDRDHSYLGLMAFDFEAFMGALGGDATPFATFDVENLQSGDDVEYRS